MRAAQLCTAAGLLLHFIQCATHNTETNRYPKVEYQCPGKSRSTRHDLLTVEVPLAAAGDRLSVKSDFSLQLSLNVSFCTPGSMRVTAERRGNTRRDGTHYIIHVNESDSSALSVWLYWSFAGTEDCSIEPRLKRHPGVMVLAGGRDKGSSPVLLVENIESDGARQSFSVEVGGESFDQSQFSNGTGWFGLTRPGLDIVNKELTLMLNADSRPEKWIYQMDTNKLTLRSVSDVRQVAPCAGEPTKKVKEIVEVSSRIAQASSMWLLACLCVVMTIVICFGIVVCNCQPVADGARRGPRPSPAARVGLSGGGSFLRNGAAALSQRLAADAEVANRRTTFEVASLAELRSRSSQFDLVLLVLEPGGADLLPEGQATLLALERWRFRVLLLAAGAPPRPPAGPDVENGIDQGAALLSRGGAGVGVCVGEAQVAAAAADWLDGLFRMARDACRELQQRSRQTAGE